MAKRPRERVSFERYSTVHYATLREYDHFIEDSTLSLGIESDEVLVEGRLFCTGGVYLDVVIVLSMDNRKYLGLLRYSFHAGITTPEDRPIFRYDDAHIYAREGQPDPHHKHRFDVMTGKEIVPPEWIGADNQPTLRSVLAELEQWWLDIGKTLDP